MLNNISLNISKNGMYGLVGDNGSGKSTIFIEIDIYMIVIVVKF